MEPQAPTDTKTTDFAVELRDVTKTFRQWQRSGGKGGIIKNLFRPQARTIVALDDLTLGVRQGEFVAYAGANGAGKSTSIKLISGMLMPDQGQIRALGMDPRKERTALMRRMGILFGNRTELWWDHPVETSFEWKKAVWKIPDATYRRMREMTVELLGIGDLLNTFVRELSLGQRMRCDLALMLLHNPELILLDEPTLGLDVLAKRRLIEFLKQLNAAERTTVLVTSHDMDDLEEMARRIVLIHRGKVAYDGSFAGFRQYIGCARRVRITTKSDAPPVIPQAECIESQGGIHAYRWNDDLNVQSLLGAISAIEGVEDVEFLSTPLEEAVAGLYSSLQERGDGEGLWRPTS